MDILKTTEVTKSVERPIILTIEDSYGSLHSGMSLIEILMKIDFDFKIILDAELKGIDISQIDKNKISVELNNYVKEFDEYLSGFNTEQNKYYKDFYLVVNKDNVLKAQQLFLSYGMKLAIVDTYESYLYKHKSNISVLQNTEFHECDEIILVNDNIRSQHEFKPEDIDPVYIMKTENNWELCMGEAIVDSLPIIVCPFCGSELN